MRHARPLLLLALIALPLMPSAAATMDPGVCREAASAEICAGGFRGSPSCDVPPGQGWYETRASLASAPAQASVSGREDCWTHNYDNRTWYGRSDTITIYAEADGVLVISRWRGAETQDSDGNEYSSCHHGTLVVAPALVFWSGDRCRVGPPPSLEWGRLIP